jgi:diguanylate cyclase (GGDEF)-like protein
MSLFEDLTYLKSNFQSSANALDKVTKAILDDDKTPLESKVALENEIGNIKSNHLGNVIIFGDINNFKSINEAIGHDGGDSAIEIIGKQIQKLVVKKLSARAFRQSGDEFVIMLKLEHLQTFIEIAKKSFTKIPFNYSGKSLKLSISFGYAKSEENLEMRNQLQRADKACRPAKIKGNGECAEWNEEMKNNIYSDDRVTCQNCHTIIKVQFNNRPATKIKVCPICQNKFNKKLS